MSKKTVNELLNEKGLSLLEVKNVLLENQKNSLIYNGLLSSFKESELGKEVYQSLIDVGVNEQDFELVLLSFDQYTNTALLKERYTNFQKELSKVIERTGEKFSTLLSIKDGGIIIVKKLGVNLEAIKREFRLSEKEALKLFNDEFVETYARLKLNAVTKDIIPLVEKNFGKKKYIRFAISEFYYDKKHKVYNVDFQIIVSATEHQLKSALISMGHDVSKILTFVQKEYYRLVRN